MEKNDEELLNKLIMLFVFDKMDIALDEKTIIYICYSQTNWIMPIYCIDTLHRLLKSGMIHQNVQGNEKLFTLTPLGRSSLANFYVRIPESLRREISEYCNENRMKFKRRQEYFHTYYKNKDGTYTVWLRIIEPNATLLDLKFVVSNARTAKYVHEHWEDNAADIYMLLHDKLVDN